MSLITTDAQERGADSQMSLQQPSSRGHKSSDTCDRGIDDLDELESSGDIDRSPLTTTQEGRLDTQAFTGSSEDEDHQVPKSMELGPDISQGALTQGPSRLVVHDDGRQSLLALIINEDLVAATQEIFDETRKLEQHQKLYDELQEEITAAHEQRQSDQAALADAQGEEAQALEQSIEQQESALANALDHRDKLSHDMDMFGFNLRFAHKASHDLLRNLLDGAGLLVKPPPTADASQHQDSPTDPTTLAHHANMYETEDELAHAAVREEIFQLDSAVQLAQQEFDNREAAYYTAHHIYLQSYQSGDETMTQVDFDNNYLLSCRKLTRTLIEAEEALKAAKIHAVEIGALDSIDDGERYGGWADEWALMSQPQDVYRARQALRDWTGVESWMAEIHSSDTEAGASDGQEADGWEADSVALGESNSVVADVEWYREKIDFWREECARLRRDM